MAIKLDSFKDLDSLLESGVLGNDQPAPSIAAPGAPSATPVTPTALPPEGKAAMASPDILAPGAASGETPAAAPDVASPKPKSDDILQTPISQTPAAIKPGSQADYTQQIGKLETPKTKFSDLGVGGKIGRVLSNVGNIAGDVLAPGAMSLIPGTDLHKAMELKSAREGLANATQQDLERAQTKQAGVDSVSDVKWVSDGGHQMALTKSGRQIDLGPTLQKPESTDQDLAQAVDGALKGGSDPLQDPKVKALIAAKQASVTPKDTDKPLTDDEIKNANSDFARRWAIANPSAPVPPDYQVKKGDLQGDYSRVDNALKSTQGAIEKKTEQGIQRGDQQAKQVQGELDKTTNRVIAPWRKQYDSSTAQFDKLNQAKTEISSGASAGQAIGVITTLSGMASGQGSGVRITQAELNSMVKARGLGDDLEAVKQKIVDSGQPLTPDQVKSINGLIDDVQKRAGQKLSIINHGLDDINNATTGAEVKKIDTRIRHQMTAFEQGKVATAAQIQAYASAHKITAEQSQKQAEDEGYVVVE